MCQTKKKKEVIKLRVKCGRRRGSALKSEVIFISKKKKSEVICMGLSNTPKKAMFP